MVLILFLINLNLYYVDQPYLTFLDHGKFDIQLRFGPGGEILGFFNLGIWDRFGFGISYGASNLIGAGDPEFYEIPGVQVKILALEDHIAPQVLFGYDNQGYGSYNGTRYDIMSKGLYCLIGKRFTYPNVEFVPSLGFNYCLEDNNRFDLFVGFECLFGSSSALIFDYSPNLNDDTDQNKGYFNLGLKFILYEEIFFEIALRDLLDNSAYDQQLNRMIRLGYEQSF
jgi:hypothetical protein